MGGRLEIFRKPDWVFPFFIADEIKLRLGLSWVKDYDLLSVHDIEGIKKRILRCIEVMAEDEYVTGTKEHIIRLQTLLKKYEREHQAAQNILKIKNEMEK